MSLFSKLASGYFWYFGVIGLFMPFASVFLDDRGFSSAQIGEMLAIATATKIIGPSLWAKFADKSGKQLLIIRVGALLACSFFSLLAVGNHYWLVVSCLALFSLFSAAILPQMEVMTQNIIRRNAKIYARIRLWGSIGYVIVAVISGELVQAFGPGIFVAIGVFVLLGLCLNAFTLKQPRIKLSHLHSTGSLLSRLLSPNFMVFFVAGLLLQLSFGPYYSFFALYLRDLSYPGYAVGLFIAVSIAAEIWVFINAGRIFKLLHVKSALCWSLFLTGLRWLLLAYYGDNGYILTIAQLLHAASFGLYHSASLMFLQRHFAAGQQSRAQALYIGGVYGVGGALGAFFAGRYWLSGAGAEHSFMLAALAALLGAGVVLLMRPIPVCNVSVTR